MNGLYSEAWGAGTKVVLVHGSLATGAEEWQKQRPLAAEGFQLVVLDRRGYGRSPRATGEDFLRDADDIAAMLGDRAHLERRALDVLNAVAVVPGAVGAWRKAALLEVGGYSGTTVADDTDLTLALRRRGYVIRYDEEAVAYTEVPQTVRALIRQRLRWSFGTLQSAWSSGSLLGASLNIRSGWRGSRGH
jgi:pimeloyl-ACP methyl ester carboxylesterase